MKCKSLPFSSITRATRNVDRSPKLKHPIAGDPWFKRNLGLARKMRVLPNDRFDYVAVRGK